MSCLTFITTESLQSSSGGWSGMNANIYQQLTKFHEVKYIGPIAPKPLLFQKIFSKALRVWGIRSPFYFFSEQRLSVIKQEIEQKISNKTNILFFHGSTPWIKINTNLPYYAYLDASFHTFLHIYSTPSLFSTNDIQRIKNQESLFFEKAKHIFFSSQWALEETKKNYGVSGQNFSVVGLGGNITIPKKINVAPPASLLFISVDFQRKGGTIVVEAYKKVKLYYPELTLTIVGEKPPDYILSIPDIHYKGFLKKEDPADKKKLEDILCNSMFLIHPTQKDMTPLVIVEAGYYGVPAIAPAIFGIPEMINHEKTGFLLNQNTPEEICSILLNIIPEKHKQQTMRKKVYDFMTKTYTWQNVGHQIQRRIEQYE